MGEIRPNNAYLGMNLDSIISQVKPGQVTYAQNAQIVGFEGNMVTYQNEQGNQVCFTIPEGYRVIGTHNITENSTIILFLANPTTGASEIGKVVNCIYSTIINAPCLNFSIDAPIHKAVHKITNCSTEVYWTDGENPMRFIDLGNLPFKETVKGTGEYPCDVVTSSEVDCNKLSVRPNFSIPSVAYKTVESEGTTTAGTYQFAIQYSTSLGEAYTSYFSITNPIPLYDPFIVTPNFDYPVSRSIILEIGDIDTTGVFDFFNVAVIKTINGIASVDIVGTYQIQGPTMTITYTGQSKNGITGSIEEIFEKFPIYDTAGDITTVQDVLVYADLTTTQRLNYQQIASQLKLLWVSYKMPPSRKQYKDEINAATLRGYMRDEVYAFDLVFILKNGYQTDRFPLIGRAPIESDLTIISNTDALFEESVCEEPSGKPRWQVYNTATVLGIDPAYDPSDECYQGPYQYGEFAYWESTETYPCNEDVWGPLQGQKIRHPKFPDNSISHHHDSAGNIFPLGIRIDSQQLQQLIKDSDLTEEEKNNIAAVKVVRGNRANSKSVIAKGILYNVGRYFKEDTVYYYPNYPFNDLRPDPFISTERNGDIGAQIYSSFEQQQSVGGGPIGPVTQFYEADIPPNTWKAPNDVVTVLMQGSFGGTDTNVKKRLSVRWNGTQIYQSELLTVTESNSYTLTVKMTRIGNDRIDIKYTLQIFGQNSRTINTTGFITGVNFNIAHTVSLFGQSQIFSIQPGSAQDGDVMANSIEIGYKAAPVLGFDPNLLNGFDTPESTVRYTFHSPDTSFYQPYLGNILKLESVEHGVTRSHFVEVEKHSRYRFPSLESYLVALGVGIAIGFASGTYGVSTNPFSGAAAFTAFQVFNDIVFRLLPRKNMTYSFNSVGNYTTSKPIPNDTGNKVRMLDIAAYLISGMQGIGDTHIVNNYQRESSVYLRTTRGLPFPNTIVGVPTDNSRFTLGEVGCIEQFYVRNISSYYASIKNIVPDQYGQIYSYEAVDTGFQLEIDLTTELTGNTLKDIFGGDTFINKFAFKRKLPFFIDNRVNFPDDSDVFYDELGNVGYPRYWFSTDVKRGDGGAFNIGALFGVKINNFDCENSAFFYDAGKIYLFAYGIVNFFVESQVNVDLRQAYNNEEGDYWPHVGSDVPDKWLQEANVPIVYDNTYTYNKTFSKQNTENVFTTLPVDFDPTEDCVYNFPNRAIYSERQQDVVNYKKNNWRIYRPAALYDFPLNFGKLTAIDGIETRQLLARFENRTQLYNSLLTTASSIGEIYLGQQIFNPNIPPVDFASTDQGYTGSQHKFILNTEFGHVWVDSKRGDVFVMGGKGIEDISNEGVKLFLTNNLPFQIKEAFPDYNIDNNFKGVGLHGVYDTKYNRIIITKLDYKPLTDGITYDSSTDVFTLGGQEISLDDPSYFCDVSFTISYSFISKSWVSFHSYLPNYYIGGTNEFYTGRNDLGSAWLHNIAEATYNNFYGTIEPYIIEVPFAYKYQDEILQSVKDYSKVNKMINAHTYIQTNNNFFNKAVVYNDQQCSGVLNLIPKPLNNLSSYLQYPKYNADSKDILFVKSDNFYNYNGFWDIVKDYNEPIWLPDCTSNSENKILNDSNLDYASRTFKKYPLRAKDCRIRHILDDRSDVRITSQLLATETQTSYK
jgi:hypothetical protein